MVEHLENGGFLKGKSQHFDQFSVYEIGTDRAWDRVCSGKVAGAHILGRIPRSTSVWWKAVYDPK